MTPVYSIVIPVYNAEKYLEKCIESVFAQNSASAFEIILVNDGSRDGSAVLCDRFAAEDNRISAIHQKNQGVSAARNAGISAAKGQYVLFLDSDDLWEPDLLASVDQVVLCRPDMIGFGYCHFTDDKVGASFLPTHVADGQSGEDCMKWHEEKGIMPIVSVCVTVFRRQFLLENNLRFPLGVSFGEDLHFSMHCLKQAKSVCTINKVLYKYRMNDQSATHTLTPKKIHDLLSTCVDMYKLFPNGLFADYYCMSIWNIEGLTRQQAKELDGFLRENSYILQHISGKKARIALVFYKVLGWHGGAKLLRILSDARHLRKG